MNLKVDVCKIWVNKKIFNVKISTTQTDIKNQFGSLFTNLSMVVLYFLNLLSLYKLWMKTHESKG